MDMVSFLLGGDWGGWIFKMVSFFAGGDWGETGKSRYPWKSPWRWSYWDVLSSVMFGFPHGFRPVGFPLFLGFTSEIIDLT